MTRRVEWEPAAARDLRRLSLTDRERVVAAVLRLAETDLGDIRKLTGSANEWRLRVGDWRVRYTYGDDGALIVFRVLPRGRAYR